MNGSNVASKIPDVHGSVNELREFIKNLETLSEEMAARLLPVSRPPIPKTPSALSDRIEPPKMITSVPLATLWSD